MIFDAVLHHLSLRERCRGEEKIGESLADTPLPRGEGKG
jgi:hypothetical protein